MLPAVLAVLRCPVCGSHLDELDAALRCPSGHSFDLARQRYASLATGRNPGTGDTPAMVAARETFLTAGHFTPIAETVCAAAGRQTRAGSGLVVDLGGGTGWYAAQVLDALPGRFGLCLDLSAAALRRAARAHPRLAAASADAWQRLPLADGCADLVLVTFAPRNAAEIARVLAPGGVLLLVSPDADHLSELRGPLGLIEVDPDKRGREAIAFAGFTTVEVAQVRYPMTLDRAAVAAVAGMGPSAGHTEDLPDHLASLPETVTVTASVRVTAMTPIGP